MVSIFETENLLFNVTNNVRHCVFIWQLNNVIVFAFLHLRDISNTFKLDPLIHKKYSLWGFHGQDHKVSPLQKLHKVIKQIFWYLHSTGIFRNLRELIVCVLSADDNLFTNIVALTFLHHLLGQVQYSFQRQNER